MKRVAAINWGMLFALFSVCAMAADDAKEAQALLKELDKSKVSLADGIRQAAKVGAAPISAKFELEDGKLSLSVVPEGNVLQELSGSPESAAWTPRAPKSSIAWLNRNPVPSSR